MEIATLGLAIDSRQAVTAAAALDNLATAAKPAAAAVAAVEGAAKPASTALMNLDRAAQLPTASLRGQRQVLRGLTTDLMLLSPALGAGAHAMGALYIANQYLARGF